MKLKELILLINPKIKIVHYISDFGVMTYFKGYSFNCKNEILLDKEILFINRDSDYIIIFVN